MSPLARSLLALACAALLHASSADMAERVKSVLPNWTADWPCANLNIGIRDDQHSKKVDLPVMLVPGYTKIYVANAAESDQALIGQHMLVCDKLGGAKKVTVAPVTPNKHSPIRYSCYPPGACHSGVVVFTDQYVIKKLL